MGDGLKSIGKGTAIFGMWLAWGLAMRAAPMLMVGEFGDLPVGMGVAFVLSLTALVLVFIATLKILDRWDRN